MNDEKLDIRQAYRSMFYFLEREFQRNNSDDLGALLGSLSWQTWEDGAIADPAVWQEWQQAVSAALQEGEINLPSIDKV